METAQSRLQSPLRKLRKMLKKAAKYPTPQRIHDLRTRVRHADTVIRVALNDTKLADRLLQSIKPLYKKAGKVRDMDVLTGFVADLQVEDENECKTRLLEFLVTRRQRAAKKLRHTLSRQRPRLDRQIRRCVKKIEKSYAGSHDKIRKGCAYAHDANPLALRLAAKLASSPKLNGKNLHRYRAKVKELRYLLSLAGNGDAKFSDSLRDVKDSIGAWHDWNELAAISSKVLNHGSHCKLQNRIAAIAAEQFEEAVDQANALQRQAFPRANRANRTS